MIIEPSSGWHVGDLREFWRYRELLYFLVWRDVKLRFKQTVLGIVWIVLRPLLSMLMFTAVFAKLAKLPSEGVPYPLFVLAAMLPWNFFSASISAGTQSLVGNAHLISKVYFPRLIVPVSAVASALIETLISFALLAAVMLYYRRIPPLRALAMVPLLLGVTVVVSLGASLWLSATHVRFRDVGNTIPFLLQIWLYATPVVYPLALVPARFQWLVILNPLTGVVTGFRWALLGTPPPAGALLVSVISGIVLLATGLFFFRSAERTFADTV